MKRTHKRLAAILLATLTTVTAGCNQGTYIPLADVPPPPAQDPSLRKKVATPSGSSPSELSYPAR